MMKPARRTSGSASVITSAAPGCAPSSALTAAVTSKSTVSLVLYKAFLHELELRDASITSKMTRKGSVADVVGGGHRCGTLRHRPDEVLKYGPRGARRVRRRRGRRLGRGRSCVKIWSDDASALLRTLDAAKKVTRRLDVSRVPVGRKLVAGLKSGGLLEVDAASGDTKEARDSDGSTRSRPRRRRRLSAKRCPQTAMDIVK